jgi:hypothetical protein
MDGGRQPPVALDFIEHAIDFAIQSILSLVDHKVKVCSSVHLPSAHTHTDTRNNAPIRPGAGERHDEETGGGEERGGEERRSACMCAVLVQEEQGCSMLRAACPRSRVMRGISCEAYNAKVSLV